MKKELTYQSTTGREEEKLRELIIYISQRCAEDASYGSTKLNKILLKADCISFGKYGRSISGYAYWNQPNGPIPKGLISVRKKLVENRDLAMEPRSFGGFPQKRPVALREADVSALLAQDIMIIDQVIHELWGKTATDVSNASHGLAWHSTLKGEEIPYEAFLLSTSRTLTESETRYVQELNENFNWEAAA